MRDTVKRERIAERIASLHAAICALSVGDIDSRHRQDALESLSECDECLRIGFSERDREWQIEEDARILKAYREGKLVETA